MIKFILPLFICCSLQAQIVIRGATLRGVVVGTTNATGGGGGGCTPSYANTGGTGNRTAIVTTTQSGPAPATILNAAPASLVDGDTSSNGRNFWLGRALNGADFWVVFDFGSAVLITEAKYYQQDTTAQATWQWQGSSDNSSWTDIGANFALGGVATQTITSLSGNTTSYRYYRLLGISGTPSNGPWIYQFEFKICGLP